MRLPFKILLIEDDEIDIESVQRALAKHEITTTLVTARNGIEALSLLQDETSENYLRQPYVILLDLNMPRMNGHEFLHILRQDPRLASSVVFVLTTSNSQRDIKAAYEKQVAGYILKSGPDLGVLLSFLNSYGQLVEFPLH